MRNFKIEIFDEDSELREFQVISAETPNAALGLAVTDFLRREFEIGTLSSNFGVSIDAESAEINWLEPGLTEIRFRVKSE